MHRFEERPVRGGRSTVRRARRATALGAAALALTVLGTSCASSSPSGGSAAPTPGSTAVAPVDEGPPKDGGKLVVAIDAEPDNFDTVGGQFTPQTSFVASSMIEALVAFDKDRNVVPVLAASIEPRDLATAWTIKLKPNIRFHDGAPMDAQAVVANLEAARKGIGGVALKPIDTYTATDALTIEVKMNQPFASYPSTLASQGGFMVSPATIGKAEYADKPVGTGPFVFSKWNRGASLEVTKNPTYWQSGEPHLDSIDFRFMTDDSTRVKALASGDVNVITTAEPRTLAQFRGKSDVTMVEDTKGDAENVTMNRAQPPFDNEDARRAVILATDSKAVADTIGQGTLTAIDQPFPQGTPYYEGDSKYLGFDLDKAKQAAQRYEQATGKPIEFSLISFAGTTNSEVAQVLQEQWAKAGIKATLESRDQAESITQIVVGNFQAMLGVNFGYPDPDFNYLFWHSSFTAPMGQLSINFAHMNNDELDKILLDGRVNLYPPKRQEAYRRATQLLNEDAAYVWLYRQPTAVLGEPNVRGLDHIRDTDFAVYTFKPWYGDLWLDRR